MLTSSPVLNSFIQIAQQEFAYAFLKAIAKHQSFDSFETLPKAMQAFGDVHFPKDCMYNETYATFHLLADVFCSLSYFGGDVLDLAFGNASFKSLIRDYHALAELFLDRDAIDFDGRVAKALYYPTDISKVLDMMYTSLQYFAFRYVEDYLTPIQQ